jgi:hypothetical protein
MAYGNDVESRERARRQAIFEDLQAGGPTRRLYRNASITLGAILMASLGVLAVRASRPDRASQLVERYESFADEMCACRDRACADKVNAEMTTWAEETAKSDADTTPDTATMKHMTDVAEKLSSCMSKLMQ